MNFQKTNFMKTSAQIREAQVETSKNSGFAVETTFVLFFLAVEFGRGFNGINLDNVFLAMTLLMVMILPYFLSGDEKPNFKSWVVGRSFITVFAIMLGLIFKQSLGVVLPETFRFLPMTLLIITAMLSCYIQFYSFLKIRILK